MPFIIKPLYKSTGIIYPANVTPYSTESPTEQMNQVLQSTEIRDNLINKYHLYRHYNIDTISPYKLTRIIGKMKDRIIIEKTEYESIEIDVLDVNPDTAAMIANSVIDFYNQKMLEMNKIKSRELMEVYRKDMIRKKREADSLDNEMYKMRTVYGILDYGSQSKEVVRTVLRGKATNGSIKSDTLMKNLKYKGGNFIKTNDQLGRIRYAYLDLKLAYENVLRDVEKTQTYAHIVTKPAPDDKKVYPIRWLVVTTSTISTLFLTLILIVLFEIKRKQN